MVAKIGEMLNPGGRAFINVRSASDVRAAKSKFALDEGNAEYVITNKSKRKELLACGY